jgi:hypothetical protein
LIADLAIVIFFLPLSKVKRFLQSADSAPKDETADGEPVRRFDFSVSYCTVRVNCTVCTTLSAGFGIPELLGGVDVAVIVTVEVPLGVVKAAVPLPQPETPAKETKSMQAASDCINKRRLAFLLPANPKMPRPSNRPAHQKIPVGVIIGAWFTLTVSVVETTGTRYVAFGGVVLVFTANPSTAGTKLQVA